MSCDALGAHDHNVSKSARTADGMPILIESGRKRGLHHRSLVCSTEYRTLVVAFGVAFCTLTIASKSDREADNRILGSSSSIKCQRVSTAAPAASINLDKIESRTSSRAFLRRCLNTGSAIRRKTVLPTTPTGMQHTSRLRRSASLEITHHRPEKLPHRRQGCQKLPKSAALKSRAKPSQ